MPTSLIPVTLLTGFLGRGRFWRGGERGSGRGIEPGAGQGQPGTQPLTARQRRRRSRR